MQLFQLLQFLVQELLLGGNEAVHIADHVLLAVLIHGKSVRIAGVIWLDLVLWVALVNKSGEPGHAIELSCLLDVLDDVRREGFS